MHCIPLITVIHPQGRLVLVSASSDCDAYTKIRNSARTNASGTWCASVHAKKYHAFICCFRTLQHTGLFCQRVNLRQNLWPLSNHLSEVHLCRPRYLSVHIIRPWVTEQGCWLSRTTTTSEWWIVWETNATTNRLDCRYVGSILGCNGLIVSVLSRTGRRLALDISLNNYRPMPSSECWNPRTDCLFSVCMELRMLRHAIWPAGTRFNPCLSGGDDSSARWSRHPEWARARLNSWDVIFDCTGRSIGSSDLGYCLSPAKVTVSQRCILVFEHHRRIVFWIAAPNIGYGYWCPYVLIVGVASDQSPGTSFAVDAQGNLRQSWGVSRIWI